MASTRVVTDEELLRLPRDGNKYEVVEGELRVSPAGWRHERLVARLISALEAHARRRGLGDILGSNALYVLPGGNRRAPDVSFVAAGRLAREAAGAVFPALAPDLAVEIVSPADEPRLVLDKVGEYLQAGVRLVWVLDFEARQATVYRRLTTVRAIDETGTLDGEDVLPGFACPLAEILDPPEA
jgi:Uma2 family endonuclease